ncbi:MAG: hypothetical protein ABTD50_19430 [Polyangiaceae bacterium]|jgi:hypothetical protein
MKALLKIVIPASLAFAALVGPQASADQPGKHPAFLHALTDLRFARANLEKKPGDVQVKWDEGQAIGAIDGAIRKIKEAAIDDGKNLSDHPAVDATLARAGRLHHALEALQAAHADVDKEEDNAFAQGLKRRAAEDIDLAILRTKEGLCNAGDKAFCPR